MCEASGVLIRNHWWVETHLHWSLDISFDEDSSRVRVDNAAENSSRVCRIALMLLKQENSAKVGVKGRRLNAGWVRNYLLKSTYLDAFALGLTAGSIEREGVFGHNEGSQRTGIRSMDSNGNYQVMLGKMKSSEGHPLLEHVKSQTSRPIKYSHSHFHTRLRWQDLSQ